MKSRRLRISHEVETEAPLSVLRKKDAYEMTVEDPDGTVYAITILQVLVDVQQTPKAETKKRAR